LKFLSGEKAGYISISVRRGRGKSNTYTINRKSIPPVLPKNGKSTHPIFSKIGNPDFLSKSEVQTSPELEREEERENTRAREEEEEREIRAKAKNFLNSAGLTRKSLIWQDSFNGDQE
jgi:hypothetical protein